MILDYNNRRPVAMAAILDKNSSAEIFGDFGNFPDNFSFLHVYQVEP